MAKRPVVRIFVSALLLVNAACPMSMTPQGESVGVNHASDFASAPPVDLTGGSATLTGTLGLNGVHVYDLGAGAVGDRYRVVVRATGDGRLDPLAALFNAQGELYDLNDNTSTSTSYLDATLNRLVRTPSDHFYLAIAPSRAGWTAGSYAAQVSVTHGESIERPVTQYLMLDFHGGSVTIPQVGAFDLDPFNAADINIAYLGRTDEIKSGVLATVRENYAATGIIIMTTDDAAPPAPCAVSTLYFGAANPDLLGMAQTADHQDQHRCDDGIVFTDQFSRTLAATPDVSGICVAIGNVASHEAGHLLGLEHTTDAADLMNTFGTPTTLVTDLQFGTAPLDTSVFPIGMQNGPLLLNEVIPTNHTSPGG